MSSLKVLVYALGITVWLGVCQDSSNGTSLQSSSSKISGDSVSAVTTQITPANSTATVTTGSHSANSASMKATQSQETSATVSTVSAKHRPASTSGSVVTSTKVNSNESLIGLSTAVSPSATVSVTSINTAADASGSVMISSNGNFSQLHAVSSTSMSLSATVSVTAMDTAADASGSVMISSNGNFSQFHAVSSTSMSLSPTVAATTSNVSTKAFPSSLPSAEKGNASVVGSNTTDSSSSQLVSATSMVQSQNSVSVAASFNSITRSLSPSVSQSRILAVSNNSSLYQTRSETSVFRSMTQSPTILPTKNMNISANSSTLALSQSVDGGTNSVNISRSSYSAHSSFISEISPRLNSPLPSSSAVFVGKTSVSSSVAAKVTSNETPSVSMPSASGQSSKKTYSSYSAVVQSSNVIQSTPVESSSVNGKSSSEGLITMTTQHLGRSLITSMKNITISARVNATPSSPSISPVTSAVQPRPTLPPQGTKWINMEVSFDLAFKAEYNDPNSPEYKSLERNLTIALENVYKSLKGFVGVRIVLIKKGSVVCRFIVILAKDSEVDGNDLTETLQRASESGILGYVVKNIEVKVEATTETVEKLPEWALVIMILLGCLAFIFLIALIHFCVKYRRSVLGDSGEVELVQTYDKVENNKNRGYQGQKSAINRRVIASHTNPTYGAYDALGD